MVKFIKNARILTMDDDKRELENANILVRGSIIEAIGENVVCPAAEDVEVIDASGKLVMPGVINSHFHSFLNLCKGVPASPLSTALMFIFGNTLDNPPLPEDPDVAERISYLTTALGTIEMQKVGVTGVIEDSYYFPNVTAPAVNGHLNAYVTSGLRATVSMAQWNEPEYRQMALVSDLLDEDTIKQMDALASKKSLPSIIDNYRQYIETWHGAASGRIHASVSISAPERSTDELIIAASELANEYGIVLDSHVLEAKYQRVLSMERWGKSAIAHLDDLGVLNERVHLNHAIWLDDKDIEILAARGCSVSHNIHCNLLSGSGIMHFHQMHAAGIPIGIGVDEVDSDGTCNPWGVAKTANIASHITDPDWCRWSTPEQLLGCLTRGGARGMCRENEVGMLAPGFEADLIMIDLNTLPFTPLVDLQVQLLLSNVGRNVDMTMVAGEVVMKDGKSCTFDENEIMAECRELADHVFHESPTVEKLYPLWREAQLGAEHTEVGFDRLLKY